MDESETYKYDVAISYARENRPIAEGITNILMKNGLIVFYAPFQKRHLWGKKLSTEFKKSFGESSRFVLILISHHYAVKDWTDFEFSIAKDEGRKREREFILPLKLDETKLVGLHRDISYLDFKKEGLDGIANCLVEKVESMKSKKTPDETFRDAFNEWKLKGFLPGEAKALFFLNNIQKISFDVETCEFLLRSIDIYYTDLNLREKLNFIDRQILFDGSVRLLKKNEEYYIRSCGMKYLVFTNAKKAEDYLWNIYKDSDEDLGLRTEALEMLWKCESERGMDESYSIALIEPKWKLRCAAIKNIGHGNIRKETIKILAEALRDKRWEVRTEAALALVRLKLDDLVPDLIHAIQNERSRKGGNRLVNCLWYFNYHSNVKKFIQDSGLSKSFLKPPDYHAILHDEMDEFDLLYLPY